MSTENTHSSHPEQDTPLPENPPYEPWAVFAEWRDEDPFEDPQWPILSKETYENYFREHGFTGNLARKTWKTLEDHAAVISHSTRPVLPAKNLHGLIDERTHTPNAKRPRPAFTPRAWKGLLGLNDFSIPDTFTLPQPPPLKPFGDISSHWIVRDKVKLPDADMMNRLLITSETLVEYGRAALKMRGLSTGSTGSGSDFFRWTEAKMLQGLVQDPTKSAAIEEKDGIFFSPGPSTQGHSILGIQPEKFLELVPTMLADSSPLPPGREYLLRRYTRALQYREE